MESLIASKTDRKSIKIKVNQRTEFDLSGKKADVGIAVSALLDLKEKLELNSIITQTLFISLHTAKFSDGGSKEKGLQTLKHLE